MAGEGPQLRPEVDAPRADVLDSWKGIAVYLKREVRTVQRWEKNLGLPVRRLSRDKQGAVFAYRSEIDAWWRERETQIRDTKAEEEEMEEALECTPKVRHGIKGPATLNGGEQCWCPDNSIPVN